MNPLQWFYLKALDLLTNPDDIESLNVYYHAAKNMNTLYCKFCGLVEPLLSENGPHIQARCPICNGFIKFVGPSQKNKSTIKMENIITNCKNCNNDEFYFDEKIFSNGTKHIAQVCRQCDTFQKYVPQNNPLEIMPFGKYKGQRIDAIMDKTYLTWLLKNLKSGQCNMKNPEKLIKALEGRLK